VQAFLTNGFDIRLIRDEHKEVRRDELQLLEGADAGLFDSPWPDRSNQAQHGSGILQAGIVDEIGSGSSNHYLEASVRIRVLHGPVVYDR
jgi:hypothetical protein